MRISAYALGAISILSGSAQSQNCSGNPGILLTVSDSTPSIGGPFTLTTETVAGDLVLLLVGTGGTPIQTPYGPLCVALPAAIVTFTQVAPVVQLPATVPFDMNLVGLALHFQFFSKSPGTGPVHLSNAVSIEIDDGTGAPYPIEVISKTGVPSEPALADLDGDGALDLVTPFGNPVPAEIAYGLGNGTFEAPMAFSDAAGHGVALARDLDGDGDLDILLAETTSVRAWKNVGSRQFTLSGSAPTGGFGMRMTTSDFDLDGDVDVATANSFPSSVSVLISDGMGGLSASQTYTPGPSAAGIVSTDLNSDGDADLAVTFSGVGAGVALFLGQPGAWFAPAGSTPTGPGPAKIAAGDLNADGRPDLVVSEPQSDVVRVLRNQTTSFVPSALIAGDEPIGVAIMDLDADGILDIGVANSSSATIGLFRGLGSMTFSSMESRPAGGVPSFVIPGDLDQDGRLDFVVNVGTPLAIAVHMDRDGAGFGSSGGPSLTSPAGVRAAVLGDFDQDSHTDVYGIDNVNSKLLRYSGDGTGNLTTETTLNTVAAPYDVATADLDHDSELDLLVSGQNAVSTSVLLGDGAGGFVSSTINGLREGLLSLGDLDGDGSVDFVATGKPSSGANSQFQGFRGLGNGTFTPWASLPTLALPSEIELGDIDLDGDLDSVVTSSGSAQLQIYRGDGLGGFVSASSVPLSSAALDVTLVDLDNDGDLDAVAAATASSNVLPCFGNGLGSFTAGSPIAVYAPSSDIAIADLNGDQRLDIAAVSTSKWTVSIAFGAPGGTFPIRREFASAINARQILVGMVNHDAMPDLVTISTSPLNSVTISLHR